MRGWLCVTGAGKQCAHASIEWRFYAAPPLGAQETLILVVRRLESGKPCHIGREFLL
jgi:hypothetical protein